METPTRVASAEEVLPIPLALQLLFYELQTAPSSVSTHVRETEQPGLWLTVAYLQQLTRAFGWSRGDVVTQHDIQELSRVLIDNLEQKMIGSASEGANPFSRKAWWITTSLQGSCNHCSREL